ncbi:MAG: DUF502 domain-containing protein [Rhodospirillaceae bacterium]
MTDQPGAGAAAPQAPRHSGRGWNPFRHLRAHFLAGVLVVAPFGLTIYFVWLVVHWIDQQVNPLLPDSYNPQTYLPFYVPGFGLLIVLVALTLIGAVTRGLLGRFALNLVEHLFDRMPVVRGIYGAIKQIFETLLSNKSQAFREVALIEYPRHGIWTLGFITSSSGGEIQNRMEEEMVNVFVPTTPNPTSGFLLFVPRRDVVVLSMTIEDGFKMIISGGMVTPPDRRPETLQETPTIAARARPHAALEG